jgi:hypothetical protein
MMKLYKEKLKQKYRNLLLLDGHTTIKKTWY